MPLPQHRPFIDGLRAFAVIIVLLFHIEPGVFSAGYLGVDIFFVISGFVISQSLYKNYIKNGQISIVDFYVRRFKRLYPALLVMVLVTTLFYIWLGFLWDTNLYLKSALSSIFAFSNLYFLFKGGSYFHQDLINPLTHTWSLGLEEQFYLVYPIFLAVTLWWIRKYRLSLKTLSVLFFGISLIFFASFSINSYSIWGDFFFPLARFWEIGVGCALFFVSQYFLFKSRQKLIVGLALTGLLVFQFVQPYIDVVQIETLITVILTALLILAGLSSDGRIIGMLQHKVTTYIGRLSYSLYLWHLPVIYFLNLYTSKTIYYVLTPILSIILAALSYHFIEQPFRMSENLDKLFKKILRLSPVIISLAIITVLVVGQYNVRVWINNSFNKFSENIYVFNKIESDFNLGDRIQPNYLLDGRSVESCTKQGSDFYQKIDIKDECLKTSDRNELIYLTGDSHALHLISMLDNSNTVKNIYFTEIPRQAIVSEDPELFDMEKAGRVIDQQKNELDHFARDYEEIYYVISFFFSPWQSQGEAITDNMYAMINSVPENIKIILVAPTPVFPAGPQSCVLLGTHCSIDKNEDLDRRKMIYDLYRNIESEYGNVFVYDPYEEICPSERCVNYDPDTEFLYYMDKDHLSVEHSKKLYSHFDKWFESTFNQ